jgi:hypothetical protein
VPGRDLTTAFKVLLALVVVLLGANRALAYAGPGVDVTFINTAMTLLLWVGAMFSAVLLWPLYTLLGWIRRRKNKSPSLEAAPEETRAVSPSDS